MKIKTWITLPAILFASSFTFAQDYQAKQANEAIMVCQYKAAIDLDDGVSDVRTLSPIIADWCKKESDQFYRIIQRGINGPFDERAARQANREKDLENDKVFMTQLVTSFAESKKRAHQATTQFSQRTKDRLIRLWNRRSFDSTTTFGS